MSATKGKKKAKAKPPPKERLDSCPNCGEEGYADDTCAECGRKMCEKCTPFGLCALCQYEASQYPKDKTEDDIWEAFSDMMEDWVVDDEWV